MRECLLGRRGGVLAIDPADKGPLLASLEALARGAVPSWVLVSAETARFLEPRFDLAPIETGEEAGAPTAYRLLGRGRGAGGRHEGHPLVGRDRELAVLDDLLVQAEQSRRQAVGLSGEPGTGKSRLLREFCQGLESGRVTYVEGRCVSYGQPIPYLPILDFVRQDFAIEEGDAPDVVAGKVEQSLQTLGLDWIDHASEEVLNALVDSAAGCRMLLLGTYRPGYRPPWLARSYATQLVLGRLSDRDSVAIVREAAGGRAMPGDLTGRIVACADGNPFFLEELARACDRGDAADEMPAAARDARPCQALRAGLGSPP